MLVFLIEQLLPFPEHLLWFIMQIMPSSSTFSILDNFLITDLLIYIFISQFSLNGCFLLFLMNYSCNFEGLTKVRILFVGFFVKRRANMENCMQYWHQKGIEIISWTLCLCFFLVPSKYISFRK